MEFIPINFFYFVWLLAKFWNINSVFDFLTKKHGNVDFVVNCVFKKIYLVNSENTLKTILSLSSNELTFIQRNFNTYMGHTHTINCYDSNSTEWKNLHHAIKITLNKPTSSDKEHANPLTESIGNIMVKYVPILFKKYPTLNEAVEVYITKVLAEFNYGENVNFKLYTENRKLILKYLGRFHRSKLVRVPLVGRIWCMVMNWYYREELVKINKNLDALYNNCSGVVKDFANEMQKLGVDDSQLYNTIIETTMLLVLENDFIHSVMLDSLLQESVSKLEESVHNGFLYPVRYRFLARTIGMMPAGSLVIYNLLNANLQFSWGPRACVGQTMVKNTIWPIIGIIKNFVSVDRSQNWYSSRRTDNLPVIKPIDKYEIKLPLNYIEKTIPSYHTADDVKIYHIMAIYQKPLVFGYCVYKFCEMMKGKGYNSIVAPEARGFSLAGAISWKLRMPLFSIRKEGKIPGPVYRKQFTKGYTKKPDVLEIDILNFEGKKIALIDDGIASGGSMNACIELIKSCNGVVSDVYVMVKHNYEKSLIQQEILVHHLFEINKY